jgi:glycosyltransferase involved in cell wall biosynthesis
MKILFVCQYFYPETFRGNDICFDWATRGDDVTVVTGIPNYPMGHFFKGYSYIKRRKEVINGVKVVRVPIIPRGEKSSLLLLLNFFSFAISASIYVLYKALTKRYDRVFVQQLSPVMMSIPAIIYKKLRRVPLYTWVLDLWPESLQAAGGITNKYILNFFGVFSKCEYKNSDKILMSSKAFSKSILSSGSYQDKLVYFPNWAEDVFSKHHEITKKIPLLPKGFKVMFAGNVGEAQDFEHIMDAAFSLKENKAIQFVIVGDGRKKEWVDTFVHEHQLEDTVHMLGRWPIETMPLFFDQADVMLVSLKDELIFNLTAPAKIQAYMQSKKPIVGMINGEGASIINEAQCGRVVDAANDIELAHAITEMSKLSKDQLNTLGANGYNYCQKNFNKTILMDYLYKIIH